MLKLRERKSIYHIDWIISGRPRLRGTLETQNRHIADTIRKRLELAAAEGPKSQLWPELSRILPERTFKDIATHFGVKEKHVITWTAFLELYYSHRYEQLKTGAIVKNTFESYRRTINEFDCFLKEKEPTIKMLRDIDGPTIDRFKAWRVPRIRVTGRSRNGESTLELEVNHLHQILGFAEARGLIDKNPVQFIEPVWNSIDNDKKPYTGEELLAMRQNAGDDLFLFIFLKFTGFRRSDAAMLLCRQVLFDRGANGEIEHVPKKTKKKRRKVILPLVSEFREALEAEFRRRRPSPDEPVLLTEPMSINGDSMPNLFEDTPRDPSRPLTEKELERREHQIYNRIKRLGERAGVPDAHPHRFRHTFAVDSLLRGASVMLVARMMGDTEQTVMDTYLHLVEEIRDRLQFTLETGLGLEEIAAATSQRRHIRKQLPFKIKKTLYLVK
jgi:integrase